MSKNLKLALLATIILAVVVVGFFYQDHEDSKTGLASQPVVITKTNSTPSSQEAPVAVNVNKETNVKEEDTIATKTSTQEVPTTDKQKPAKK